MLTLLQAVISDHSSGDPGQVQRLLRLRHGAADQFREEAVALFEFFPGSSLDYAAFR